MFWVLLVSVGFCWVFPGRVLGSVGFLGRPHSQLSPRPPQYEGALPQPRGLGPTVSLGRLGGEGADWGRGRLQLDNTTTAIVRPRSRLPVCLFSGWWGGGGSALSSGGEDGWGVSLVAPQHGGEDGGGALQQRPHGGRAGPHWWVERLNLD